MFNNFLISNIIITIVNKDILYGSLSLFLIFDKSNDKEINIIKLNQFG